MPLHILLWSPLDDYLADLLDSMHGVRLQRVASVPALADALPGADAIIMLGHFYTAEVAALVRMHGTRLRWIQLTTAGYDGISFHGVPDGVTVTNAGSSHAPMVAEHAVTLLTALIRRLPALAVTQSQRRFDRSGIGQPLTTLENASVVILGYGAIGRETARRVTSFGARVIGIARSARADEFATAVHPVAALRTQLRGADALIVAAALTPETKGLVDADVLGAMKPGGVLVNVARGGIVNTGAAMDALRSGHLAGAGLDVTDPEPLAPDHPLWDCPNLIVTPHVSGIGSPAVRSRIASVVEQNVLRFSAGTALLNVIS
jgi:phosphoglycerate dehydrogenase-like enzyme